jgi:hypothetical protein
VQDGDINMKYKLEQKTGERLTEWLIKWEGKNEGCKKERRSRNIKYNIK